MRYLPSDKMSHLVEAHYKILLAMNRFNIPLGFGEKTIEQVCEKNSVDTPTFMAIVHIMLHSFEKKEIENSNISIEAIIKYLQNSHNYFVNYRLPSIRSKLVKELNKDQNELTKAIVFYFDKYVTEVQKHMEYEDKITFPYIRQLMNNKRDKNYNINIFERQHNHIESNMTEFKNIIIKYYPSNSSNEINSILFDLFSCEEDLTAHMVIENELLVPLTKKMEKN